MRLRHARRAQPACESLPVAPFFFMDILQKLSQNSALQSRKAAERAPFHSRRRGARGFSSVLLAAHVLGPDAGILIVLVGIVIRLPGISNANHHATLAVGTVAVNATGDR